MRILGIDPGLNICGYAILDDGGDEYNLIEAGTFKTDFNAAIETRLNQIAVDLDSLIGRLKPGTVAVEQLYSHYAHPRTSILMGHARGVILQKAAEAGLKVKSYSATRIKKAITGNGHASKLQMQRTIQSLLRLAEMPEPPDVADAIAAAVCCRMAENDVLTSVTGRDD